MNFIKQIIKIIFKSLLPNRKEIIVFESADLFFDNSYALYLYMKNNYTNKKLYYICRTKKQYSFRKCKNIPKKDILKIYSSSFKLISKIRNVWKEAVLEKSSFAFCSYLVDDFKKLNNIKERRKVVMLWHGRAAFKSREDIFKYHFPTKNNYYYCFSTEYSKSLFLKESPILNNANHIICGDPRNDYINKPNATKLSKLLGLDNILKHRLILICCTFRTFQSTTKDYFKDEFPLALTNEELADLNDMLKKENVYILIKTHHAQRYVSINDCYNKYSNIKIRNTNDFETINLSLYETFQLTEAMITDYSSVLFDYLLVNKPIAILTTDKDKFNKEHKMLADNFYQLPDIPTLTSFFDFKKFIFDHKEMSNIKRKRMDFSLKINGKYLSNCQSVCDALSIKFK